MIITDIHEHSQYLSFMFSCAICGCRVDSTDKFCRSCGRSLTPLPQELDKKQAGSLLTNALHFPDANKASTDNEESNEAAE